MADFERERERGRLPTTLLFCANIKLHPGFFVRSVDVLPVSARFSAGTPPPSHSPKTCMLTLSVNSKSTGLSEDVSFVSLLPCDKLSSVVTLL